MNTYRHSAISSQNYIILTSHSTGFGIWNNRMQLGLQQPENTGGLTNIFERPIRVPDTREWSLLRVDFDSFRTCH